MFSSTLPFTEIRVSPSVMSVVQFVGFLPPKTRRDHPLQRDCTKPELFGAQPIWYTWVQVRPFEMTLT
jgi:hypothetical protein